MLNVKYFLADELQIDYQFTFNLSKKEDRHYTQINFRNSPSKIDIDAEFHIHCSIPAKMNITVKTGKRYTTTFFFNFSWSGKDPTWCY